MQFNNAVFIESRLLLTNMSWLQAHQKVYIKKARIIWHFKLASSKLAMLVKISACVWNIQPKAF